MQYFFCLGTNPTLSIAEITSVLKESGSWQIANEQIFILENPDINAKELIRRLGGTIKIGVIEKEANKYQILKNFQKLLNLEQIQDKFKFGISHYGKGKLNTRPLGMEVKKYLKENGKSARWVISKEPTLSSVVVEQNKLVDKGIEFVLISNPSNPERVFIGRTLAVQPFKYPPQFSGEPLIAQAEHYQIHAQGKQHDLPGRLAQQGHHRDDRLRLPAHEVLA